ncbi:hypothetical protein Tco_0713129 [Tanacetum coccineum]
MDGCTKGPQLEEGEDLNTGALGTGRTPPGGTSAPAGQAQGGLSPAFVKENIDVLRTMIKELDNRGQEKVTPRKLFNEESGETGSENSQMSPSAEEVGGYSSDGSSRSRSRGRPRAARKHRKNVSKKKRTSKSHRSVRSEARSRSNGSEDLIMPYRRSKPMPFTSRITRFRYHRRAKLPPNVRVYEGNKDPTEIHGIKQKPNEGLQAFMDRFKAESAHIKGVPPVLRISAFMHGHGHPELSKKLNDKILKTVDEMWERVRAFIRGEAAADTTEAIRSPRWEKSAGKASWSEHQNGSRNRNHRRGEGRNMGTLSPYARRKGFTPLMKTPKEILAMDNVNFPLPPPMVGTPEKRNMNKQGGQKGKGSAKGREKVINMVRSQGYRKRPYERVEHWMDSAITFPSVPRYQLMNCPVVVEAVIEGFRVRRIHVDGGSSSEVMYEHCFRSLSYRTRSRLRESRIPLVGFSGEVSYPMGVIDLEVTMGECGKTRTVIMEFAVVKSPSPYNG